MRILAIDYGTKITGIAITDFLQILASPLANIQAKNYNELINKLNKVIEPYLNEIEKIIVGYPLLLNGKKNSTTLMVEQFIELLEKTYPNKEIIIINEQFTTFVAQEDMYDVGLNHKDIKKNKDKVSACIILNSYLNKNKIK